MNGDKLKMSYYKVRQKDLITKRQKGVPIPSGSHVKCQKVMNIDVLLYYIVREVFPNIPLPMLFKLCLTY